MAEEGAAKIKKKKKEFAELRREFLSEAGFGPSCPLPSSFSLMYLHFSSSFPPPLSSVLSDFYLHPCSLPLPFFFLFFFLFLSFLHTGGAGAAAAAVLLLLADFFFFVEPFFLPLPTAFFFGIAQRQKISLRCRRAITIFSFARG
jgi:hypothetical protein